MECGLDLEPALICLVEASVADLRALQFKELVIPEFTARIDIEERLSISHSLRYLHFHSPQDLPPGRSLEPGSTQGLLALVIYEVLWISLVRIIEGGMRSVVAPLLEWVIMVPMHCAVCQIAGPGSLVLLALDTEAFQPVVSVLVIELSDLTVSLAFFPVPRHLDKLLPHVVVQDRTLLIEVAWNFLMFEYTLAELAGHCIHLRLGWWRISVPAG